jgi:hypothetical protein
MVVARFFRSSPLGGLSALLLLLLVSVAALAERVAPHNPLTANYALTRDPPLGRHVLGTDHLGGREPASSSARGPHGGDHLGVARHTIALWGVGGYLGGRGPGWPARSTLMSLPAHSRALLCGGSVGLSISSSPSR